MFQSLRRSPKSHVEGSISFCFPLHVSGLWAINLPSPDKIDWNTLGYAICARPVVWVDRVRDNHCDPNISPTDAPNSTISD